MSVDMATSVPDRSLYVAPSSSVLARACVRAGECRWETLAQGMSAEKFLLLKPLIRGEDYPLRFQSRGYGVIDMAERDPTLAFSRAFIHPGDCAPDRPVSEHHPQVFACGRLGAQSSKCLIGRASLIHLRTGWRPG